MNRVSNGKFDYLYTKRRFEETFFEVHGQLIINEAKKEIVLRRIAF